MLKNLALCCALFACSMHLKAQQTVPLFQAERVNWTKHITEENLFKGLNEIMLINDWSLIAYRIAFVNAAISSGTLTAKQVADAKMWCEKLLNLELTLLDGALQDSERIKGDALTEKTRSEKIQAQKKEVFATLHQIKNQ